jgi:hypothetical protein
MFITTYQKNRVRQETQYPKKLGKGTSTNLKEAFYQPPPDNQQLI